MSNSIYRLIDKNAVRAEYNAAADAPEEFGKAKWGSHESMVNRFELAHRLVDWTRVDRWLDVGCGTGLFFEVIERHGHEFAELLGVDISDKLTALANARSLRSSARFLNTDSLDAGHAGRFDLVTLIGVLQQCGDRPDAFLPPVLAGLKPGGQFFMTTKNAGWRAFKEDGLLPEANHSWFDHEEIIHLLTDLGMKTVETGGFLPKEDRVVPVAAAHTFYVLAERG